MLKRKHQEIKARIHQLIMQGKLAQAESEATNWLAALEQMEPKTSTLATFFFDE